MADGANEAKRINAHGSMARTRRPHPLFAPKKTVPHPTMAAESLLLTSGNTRTSQKAHISVTVLVTASVFWLAFDGGTYGLSSRSTVAIAVWWTVIVVLGLGIAPIARPPRAALATGLAFAALAGWELLSMLWAPSAEGAFTEFNRTALQLGVFVLVLVLASRAVLGRIADGIAVAIVAVGILALATRFFPSLFPESSLARFLPAAQSRLSYPLNYWNGLAIFVALGVPLALRCAVVWRSLWSRSIAVASIPALVAVIYLAASRGGFAVLAVGTGALLVLTRRRWAVGGAAAVASLASVGAIAILLDRSAIVNGPLGSAESVRQGHTAAVLLLFACLGAGLAYAVGVHVVGRYGQPGRLAGRIVVALVVTAALAGIAASNPVERFDAFKRPPGGATAAERDFVKAHLLSGNGSGRWQFWGAALDQFERNPAIGDGAGSYESWWAEHRGIPLFARDAHSFYFESMGELGIVGLLLVVGVVGIPAVTGIRRALAVFSQEDVTLAALAAAFLAFALALAIDWMWELTVVSIVGVALAALLTGPSTLASLGASEADERLSGSRLTRASGVALLVLGWLVICAAAIPFFANMKIQTSQAAVVRGDGGRALEAAEVAQRLEPWAAAPYLQLALVHEQTGDLPGAQVAVQEALTRSGRDWRIWLVKARIETKMGQGEEARRSILRAAELNPRSPIFAGVHVGAP
jgi:O-Antigen ligase